jgi:hypothetical protein
LRSDGQETSIDVHVDRSWIDTGKIGVQDILIAFTKQIHRHQPRLPACVEDTVSESVQLAEWVE